MNDARDSSRTRLLAQTPAFRSFEPDELEEVAALFREERFEPGAVVCREAEEPQRFFVVVSGALKLEGEDAGDLPERLGPGDCFGAIPLLTDACPAATLTATDDVRLLVLERRSFERHCAREPRARACVARALARAASRDEAERPRATAIHVGASPGLAGAALVAESLALLLRELSGRDVVLVHAPGADRGASLAELLRRSAEDLGREVQRRGPGPARLAVDLRGSADPERLRGELDALIGRLAPDFPTLVLELGEPAALHPPTLHPSEIGVEVVARAEPGPAPERDGAARVYQVVLMENEGSLPIPINHGEPFVIPRDRALPRTPASEQARFVRDHPASAAAVPLHRLARKLLGTSVGLALGSGGAFGIAHVGILQCLERNGIPVDLLGGSSFGSVIALAAAVGLRGDEMADIAARIGNRRTLLTLLDPALGRPGMLRGERIAAIFGPFFGSVRDFEQLQRPCRFAALDVNSGERVTIATGRVLDAIQAACAVPVIWAPFERQGRVLVDGAFVDPVPTDLVHEMGADVCFAVNTLPARRAESGALLSRLQRQARRLNPLRYVAGGRRSLPLLSDLLGNAIYTLERELARCKALSADVCIEPELSDFGAAQFYRPLDIVERGVEAAERALPALRETLAERIRRRFPAPGPGGGSDGPVSRQPSLDTLDR